MSFFAILFALLLEQARPLTRGNPAHASLASWSGWARTAVDAGQLSHGWLAWSLAVLVPAALAALVYALLWWVHPLLAFVWTVVVLYLTLGFRQFSHHFTSIRVALESGDEPGARAALGRWKRTEVADMPRATLLRQVVEYSILSAHRHVFGVLVCFVVLAAVGLGPAGAVLYRMTEHVSRRWKTDGQAAAALASAQAASAAWHVVDFVPVRVTALAFAVVGNFEEAVASWRQEARGKGNDALLLAATAGAINVRLQPAGGGLRTSPDGDGWAEDAREPQLAHLASVVGLVWRSVVLCLLLLAMGLLVRLL